MADWILVPCLVSLRAEFNAAAPQRDKATDGSVGDASHAASSSDHNPDETGVTPTKDADSRNEVHAIDVDKDLRRAGLSMEQCVQRIVLRHRTGQDGRLQNVIFDGRIWSRSWGWTARAYHGANPHDKHAHFSARYDTDRENDTRPWGLLDLVEDDMTTKAEFLTWLKDPDIRAALYTATIGNPAVKVEGAKGADGKPVFRDPGTILGWFDHNINSLSALIRAADLDEAKLADLLAARVLANLPTGSKPVTRDELAGALRTVFASVGEG
jgi:hypothetical protein